MYAEAILFDFNGTMFFDEEFQEKSWRFFLESKIGRKVTNEEFQEYVYGRNAEITLPYFLKRELSGEEIIALEEEKEIFYRKLCLDSPDKFVLAKGLTEFLDDLKQKNIPITIATASALNNVKFFFDHLELGRWFEMEKVVYNDATIPGKPEPDIYIRAAQKIGIDIEKCAVFEDAKAGIEAARRAKASKIIGVESMLTKEELMALNGVNATIKDYSDKEYIYKNI